MTDYQEFSIELIKIITRDMHITETEGVASAFHYIKNQIDKQSSDTSDKEQGVS